MSLEPMSADEHARARSAMYTEPVRRPPDVKSLADGMQAIADALGVEMIRPDERAPEPAELRALPPTHILERELTLRQERAERIKASGHGTAYQSALTLLRAAERQVRWAWTRDQIVAGWGDHCSCFGDGKIVTIRPLQADEVAANQSSIDARYCACPAGNALRVANQAQTDERHKRRAADLVRGIFDLAGDGYEAYADVSIGTYRDRLFGCPLSAQRAGKLLADDLTTWASLAPHPWLVLFGPTGTAKTGLGISLVRLLAMRGQRGLVVPEKVMLDRIRATYNRQRGSDEPTDADILTDLRTVPVLLLDDVGAPGNTQTDWAQGQIFDVLNARYSARRTTIITTNLEASEGDDLEAYYGPRIWSRVIERTEQERWILPVREPDLRQVAEGRQ